MYIWHIDDTIQTMFKLKTFFSRIMSIEPIKRQSIVSLVWQIAFTFIGFLSTMYFAHAVGAEVLGAYFLFVAYFSIIGLMTDGGFGSAAVKRISEGEEPDAYFSAFVVLRSVFVTVVIAALLVIRSYFVDLDSAGTFTWLLVALVVSLLHGVVSSGIAGLGKMGINTTAGFINNVSRFPGLWCCRTGRWLCSWYACRLYSTAAFFQPAFRAFWLEASEKLILILVLVVFGLRRGSGVHVFRFGDDRLC